MEKKKNIAMGLRGLRAQAFLFISHNTVLLPNLLIWLTFSESQMRDKVFVFC